MLDQITPLILTYNERSNIERTLARLDWARRIVVIDSFSTDGTLDILRRDRRIAVFTREFVDFAGQCNFGLTQIETRWVLSLDADYELSGELLDELRRLVPGEAPPVIAPGLSTAFTAIRCAGPCTRREPSSIAGIAPFIGRRGMRTGSASTAMSCHCAASFITTIERRCRAGWPPSSATPPRKPRISSPSPGGRWRGPTGCG